MNKSINTILCELENGERVIEGFNFDDIEIVYKDNVICSGKFSDIYQYLYQEEYLDFDVSFIHVDNGHRSRIVITLDKNDYPIGIEFRLRFMENNYERNCSD